jgi:hypothetical protein
MARHHVPRAVKATVAKSDRPNFDTPQNFYFDPNAVACDTLTTNRDVR